MTNHDRNFRNLKETLQAAAEANRTAHIGPKEAREGAEAIERSMEKSGPAADLRCAVRDGHSIVEAVLRDA